VKERGVRIVRTKMAVSFHQPRSFQLLPLLLLPCRHSVFLFHLFTTVQPLPSLILLPDRSDTILRRSEGSGCTVVNMINEREIRNDP